MQSIKICTQANQPQGIFNQYLRPLAGMTLCLFAAGLLLFTAPLRAETEQVWEFDIPAGQLEPALVNYSTVSGVSLSYTPEVVEGLNQAGLKGAYTSDRALERLLAGTGLAYRLTAANTATVKPAEEEEPILMAPLTVEGVSESVRFWLSDLPEAYEGGQVGSGGRVGLLGNQDVFDTPFSVTSYTSELIENQQAKTLADVVRNDSSSRLANPIQGNGESITIRGFMAVGDGETLYDGLPGLTSLLTSTVRAFERVEIFKGPNALLNGTVGSSSVGGAINLVPKRPMKTPLTRLTTDYDYQSRFGIHADLSRRFGSEEQFGARLNMIYHKGESAIENNEEEFSQVPLALEYRGDRLKLETMLDYTNRHLDGGNHIIRLSTNATSVPSVPDLEDAIQQPWGRAKLKSARALLRAEYNLGKNWTMHAAYGAFNTKEYSLRAQVGNLNANGDFDARVEQWSQKKEKYTWNAGIRGQFETSGITHQISLETVQSDSKLSDIYSPITSFKSNLYNPVFVAIPKFDRVRNPPKIRDTVHSSIAIADTMRFFDERVLLTAGIRRQSIDVKNFNGRTGIRISQYDKSANTPAIGLLVKPWNFMSLYGNYIEALEQGPTAPRNAVNAGEQFPPSETEQIELGVKFDLDGLGLTAGLFQIEKPSAFTDANNRFGLNGERRHRGLELNAFGELRPDLRLLGGITYIDSELTRTQGGKFDGNDGVGTPELMAVLNLEWDAPILPGLTLTARAEHMSSQYIRVDNSLKIPSYELYGLGARYKRAIGDKQFTFRMNIDNLLNKDYWTGFWASNNILYLGDPRRIILSFTVDF